MDNQITFEIRKVKDLIPYARNARTHSEEQIERVARSIKEFGFLNPIIISSDNGILAGHCRVLAAQKLGLEKIPCVLETHLSDAQKRAYILADNKLALDAGWDEELLRLEFEELRGGAIDLELTGFSLDEINDILGQDDLSTNVEEQELPEPPTDPVTKLGDTWLLGNHRLMCGDSTKTSDILILMGNSIADLWLTDPPYNLSYKGRTKDRLTIQNDSMDDQSFREFLCDAYARAFDVLRDGGVFYIFHSDTEAFNFQYALRANGLRLRKCLVWVKNNMTMGTEYRGMHEPCLYGWKGDAPHCWNNDNSQTTVLNFKRPSVNDLHPTMKPVDMLEYLIKNSTNRDDIVLDSFSGSGSTLVACERTGRIARCMELDPKYCDVIIKRWQDYTGQKAYRESDGVAFDDLTH